MLIDIYPPSRQHLKQIGTLFALRKRLIFPPGARTASVCGQAKCPPILGGHLLGVSRYLCGESGRQVPGQQLRDAVDGVFGDVGEDVAQVVFRVDAV